MLVQFFVAFVRAIGGTEEGFWIAAMNRNWNAQTPALLPDRIDSRIVDRNQFSIFVARAQAEVFQYFQPASAAADSIIQLTHHRLAEIGLVNPAPVDLGEDDKPPRIGLHHLVDHML